jgi:hypothetical protein
MTDISEADRICRFLPAHARENPYSNIYPFLIPEFSKNTGTISAIDLFRFILPAKT